MIDKVRASRDGHQFHEAWTARRALELLLPRDGLIGIAVEGLSPADQGRATKDAAEIADLSLYYGNGCRFEDCNRQEVLQFKYSITGRETLFVASDAKKTIKKFAETERDYLRRFGVEATRAKLTYKIVTNRPLDPAFESALEALAEGKRPGDKRIAGQIRQIVAAAALKGESLQHFARRVSASGTIGTLIQLRGQVARRIASWSETPDAVARNRLGALCDLVQDKAGSHGDRPPFEAWITVPEEEVRIDKYDSFGSLAAHKRARPSRQFIAALGLRTNDPFQRTWGDAEGQTILRSEAWGSRRGYGEHEKVDNGQRLLCRGNVVLHQLILRKARLAILVELRLYRKEREGDGKFIHSGVIALLSRDGRLQLIPTKRVAGRKRAER